MHLRGRVAEWRPYAVVGACAVVVYLGALWNQWAWDDVPIIYYNPLLLSRSAFWRTFAAPYWPAQMGGGLYRPLTIASYAIDVRTGAVAWFHAVNLCWHAGASIALAVLARRWGGDRAAYVAGILFAVHPVHVEAVANIVGRAELMTALFAILAVYAALVTDSVWWSLAAFACSVLSKENGAVVPGLVVWGWLLGLGRPTGRRMAAYVGGWVTVGLVYGIVRWTVLHPFARIESIAAVFVGASAVDVRLTAVAALADVARLFVFPLALRVDYSPAERTLVSAISDPRFLTGAACFGAWIALIGFAIRHNRRVEAFGLGWIGIALLPVANLLFPIGVLVAERTLYLPSAGLALAVGVALPDVAPRRWPVILALLGVAGAARTAARVPVWRDDQTVIMSELEDSPRSFDGPARMVGIYLRGHETAKAVEAFRVARGIYDRLPWLFMWGADAGFANGNPTLADSCLVQLERLCRGCDYYYRLEATVARNRGDSAVSDSLLTHLPPPVH